MTRRAGWLAASGTLWATIGWVSPLSVSSPTSSSGVVASTLTATRWATRICPSLASAQRRAARLHTVPIAVYPERSAKPIWPRVAYPCAILAPNPSTRPRRRHAAINVPAVSRIAIAILTARSAGSGQGTGSLKNTMIPSPEHWSSVPSKWLTSGPQCAMVFAQKFEDFLGLSDFSKGGVAAQIAEHDDDLAAMAFEDPFVALRNNQLGKLGR